MNSSWNSRRVGMSKRDRPPPLLKTIPQRTAAPKSAGPTEKKSRTPEKEVEIEAPPISSDEEESEDGCEPEGVTRTQSRVKPPISSESEGDESPDRADIRPTTFQSSWNSATSTSSSRAKVQYGARGSQKTYGSARSSQDSKPPSSSQRSRNGREGTPSLSQRSRNARDGPGISSSTKGDTLLRDPDKVFTGQSKRINPSSQPAPLPSRKRKVVEESTRPSTPPKLKFLDDFLLSPDGNAGGPSALNVSAGVTYTPSPERPPRTLRIRSKSPGAPSVETNLRTRFPGHSDDDSSTDSKRRKLSRTALSNRPAKKKEKPIKGTKKEQTLLMTESLPQLNLSFDADDSPLSDLSSDDDFAVKEKDSAQCPYCKRPVDGDALHKFSKGAYMTLRMQRRFCTQHKEDEARAEWKAKGYPEIDWARLDARISSHYDYLEGILRGGASHYKDALAREVKEGRKRNLAKADFNSTPGYYGEKGFRAMQEGIFDRFSELLRERTVKDGLVSARGYSLYVQAVLVPELAVRLVMEDMGVGAEGARKILEESTWVGELLCEDEGDVVDENDENLF